MMQRSIVVGFFVLGSVACTFASPTTSTYNEAEESDDGGTAPSSKKSDSATPAPGGGSCTAPFSAPDLSKLKACGGGKGHCYAADKVGALGNLTPCEGGDVCVPDSILKAAGKKLATCNSVINTPGACVSTVIKDVADNAAQLTKDTCAEDERCVPCINPLDQKPTPFCVEMGVHETSCGSSTPAGDGGAPSAPLETCCSHPDKTTAGVCIPEATVPEAQRSQVEADTCKGGNKCVPAALVKGQPVKCGSLGGIADGVCLDTCFSSMLGFAQSFLASDQCGKFEACVPCMFAKDMGMPGCN